MIADIYSNSRGNLVDFGESDSTTQRAIRSIHVLIEDMRLETNDFHGIQNTPLDFSSINKHFDYDTNPEVDQPSLISFFSNPWFR
jgi:hypothetical protein